MRNLSILGRIIVSVIVTIIFICASAGYFINVYYETLVKQRELELRRHIDTALALVKEHRERAKKNGKSQKEAELSAFKQIEKLRYGDNHYYYIFEGTIMRYHGVFGYLVGRDLASVRDLNGNFLVRRQVEEIAARGESSFIYPWLRKGESIPINKLSYNRGIPGTKYWVGTGVYIDDLEKTFWNGVQKAAIVTFILTLVLIVFSLLISRSITRPLSELRRRMISLAEGDTSSPVPEVNARDEVGEMARTLEVFKENKKYARELELINSEIEQQALHDPLTGLGNRRYFDTHFSHLRENCSRTGDYIVLFHIDLDRFKDINDTMGHAAGDLVLKHTAKILKGFARDDDFIARIGGDEFLMVGSCKDADTKAKSLANKIITALSEPLPYEGRFCRFGASIGIAVEKADTVELDAIIKNADMALYRAKDKGRNRYEIFTKSLQVEITNKNRTIEEFLDGLDLGHLIPYYQPQFDCETLDIVGVEVLARWLHPEKGVLTPDAFLNIAEDQKVLARINQAIAVQAFRDYILLRNDGLEIPKIAVNFSLDSLKDPNLISWIDNLRPFPTKFSLELIESISFEDCDEIVMDNLTQIKDRGIDIEIDDFGSSHASILGLLEARPHRLKIDRKLVSPIDTSIVHRKLLSSIVDMCRSINVPIIAEGVETLDQLHYLKKLKVDAFQGYAMAKPMQLNDLRDFLKNESWRKVA